MSAWLILILSIGHICQSVPSNTASTLPCYQVGQYHSVLVPNYLGFTLQGDTDSERSGDKVSEVGDVNGDGYADFLVTTTDSFGSTPTNITYLVMGSATWRYMGSEQHTYMSFPSGTRVVRLRGTVTAISSAGDFNRDGLDDFVIAGMGEIYVIFGSRDWSSEIIEIHSLCDGNRGFLLYGHSDSRSTVSAAGDVNSDGFSDILIGTRGSLDYKTSIFLIFGNNTYTAANVNAADLLNQSRGALFEEEFGNAVALSDAGDVNNDGVGDFVIGVPNATKTYLIFGSRNATFGIQNLALYADGQRGAMLSGAPGDGSGASVSNAGDMNGDGLSDILIGAPGQGRVYVIFGSQAVWQPASNLSDLVNNGSGLILDGQETNFGASVKGVGDFNGDGVPDILATSSFGMWMEGRVYMIFGMRNNVGLISVPTLMQNSSRGFFVTGGVFDGLGSISRAGDINGDGKVDIIIGVSRAGFPSPSSGLTHVVFGRTPISFTANSLRINDGEIIRVLGNQISVNVNLNVDVGFRVKSCQNGFFASKDAPTVPLSQFSSLSVQNGGVWFVHQAGTPAPNISLAIDFMNVSECSNTLVLFSNMPNQYVLSQNDFDLQPLPSLDEQVCVAQACQKSLRNRSGFTLLAASYPFSMSGGDVNGDNCSDMVLGMGDAVYALFGSRGPLFGGNFTSLNSPNDIVLMNRGVKLDGWADFVNAVGDFNGDNISDILAGTMLYPGYVVQVVFGSRSLNSASRASLMDGQKGFEMFRDEMYNGLGRSGAAGDVNGDGISDIIVGANYGLGCFHSYYSEVYVLFGTRNASAWTGRVKITDAVTNQMGFVLQGSKDVLQTQTISACDVNGDGLVDIVVQESQNLTGTAIEEYRTYVIFGSKNFTGKRLNMSLLADGVQGFVISNAHAICVGDINGDGRADIGAGLSFVFGSSDPSAWGTGVVNISQLMDGQRGFYIEDDACSASPAGDINGDGLDDLVCPSSMRGFFLFGSRSQDAWGSGLLLRESLADGKRAYNISIQKYNAATVGDINSDGLSDVIHWNAFPPGPMTVSFGMPSPTRVYFSANSLVVGIGERVTVGPESINVATTHASTDPAFIVITVVELQNGYFSVQPNPLQDSRSFMMKDIRDGLVTFAHSGGAAPVVRLQINVTGVLIRPLVSDMAVFYLGSRPVLTNNKLQVYQGLNVSVGTTELGVTDADTLPAGLFFIIGNLSYGQFFLLHPTDGTRQETQNFSQLNVLSGLIVFQHNGSRNPPSFTVAVTDGRSTSAPQAAMINFNYEPELGVAGSIIIDQGQPTTLTQQDIFAHDQETFRESIIIDVLNVSAGYFAYTGYNASIYAFQQFALITGGVQFVHDGSNSVPNITLRAFDGNLFSTEVRLKTRINFRPIRRGFPTDQIVVQNEDFSFVLGVTFSDNETLNYNAFLQGTDARSGSPLPTEIKFRAPDQFSGNLPSVGSYHIQILVQDTRGLTSFTTFILTCKLSTALIILDPRDLVTYLSSAAGIGLTILAYFWLRKRIARHRLGFTFANDLRKVLNLEYWDFMRFDGEVYKSKVDVFLMRLQLDHNEFYTHLTPLEQRSFSVCVAEVLTKRGLVTKSGLGGGLWGICCWLNLGWPTQLDIKAFEVQSRDIANEAVTAWKDQKKPLIYWPHIERTKKEWFTVCCCCAKPSSKDRWFVSEQGVALTALRNREGEGQNIEGQNIGGVDQVRRLREELKEQKRITDGVSATLHRLSERVGDLEHEPLISAINVGSAD